jgi:hypothetical protein
VTWRSLIHYTRYILVYDLIPLPSEISILGDHFPIEEDIEKDIMEDMMEDVIEDRSNRDTIGGLQKHGDRRYRPIDHRLWDILVNIPDTFIYHIYPYDPGSFQSHIPPHHSQR